MPIRVSHRGPAHLLALAQADEGLAAARARHHVFDPRQKPVAAAARQQQQRGFWPGKVVRRLRAGFQLDQRGDRLAVAARAPGRLATGTLYTRPLLPNTKS